MMKKLVSLLLALPILVFIVKPIFAQEKQVNVYFFWGEGCLHCAHEKPFLEELKKKYSQLEVKDFEVYNSRENQELFDKVAKAYKTSAAGVPMTFIGKDFVVGFGSENTTGKQIENLIQNCLQTVCPSPGEILEAGGIDKWKNSSPTVEEEPKITPIEAPVKSDICIHYFIQDRCSQCQNLESFLRQVAQKYQVDFKTYNVSESQENQTIYQKLQEFYGISFAGFPMVFWGDKYLIGDQSIKETIENIILRCQKEACPCPVEEIKQTLKQIPKPGSFTPEEKEKFQIEIFGKTINLYTNSSVYFLGTVLGLADGINPCMFSVLLFLLTYLLAIGSRKKAIKVGLVFVLGVFTVYFLFMQGMINLITIIGVIQKIKFIVAFFAFLASLVMIKDFFAYGKWFSLEIPKRAKPMVESLIKKGTVPSAIALALLSSLVELPCTAGIPLVYVTILAQKGGSYIFHLAWYNFFFVLPLLMIIAAVTLAWSQVDKMEKWRLNFRKYMRLIAGLILLFLAIALFMGWM